MSYLDLARNALQAKKSQQRTGATPEQKPSGGIEILPGTWIEWRSPLFGLCRGKVALVEGDSVLIDDHPITHGYHGPAWIHKDWIIKVEGNNA